MMSIAIAGPGSAARAPRGAGTLAADIAAASATTVTAVRPLPVGTRWYVAWRRGIGRMTSAALRRGAALHAILTATVAIASGGCDGRVHLGAFGDGGASVLWSADFEPGDLSQWLRGGQGGGFSSNSTGTPMVTTEAVHAGRFAGKATMTPALGAMSGNYFFREAPSPADGYYAAWLYVVPTTTVRTWLSVCHFNGSPTADGRNVYPLWDVNLYPRPDGTLAAQLFDYVHVVNLQQDVPVPFPVGRWVHLEVLVSKRTGPTGRVAVWQDGALIIDDDKVQTVANDWLQWNVGGTLDALSPPVGVVYVDDATISLTRVGAGASDGGGGGG